MTKNIKQYVPIFVGSTYTDLIPYRKAVWDILDKLKVGVSGMEIFGARSEEPLETCLNEVSKCHVFIGILGMRYGSIDEKTGKSFVQREYETAFEKSLDILIYLIDEEKAQLPPKFMDILENANKLKEFKTLLQKKHTIAYFLSPEDLATKVERDLLRVFSDKGWVVEEEKLQPSAQPEKTIELLRRFDLMPKRFAGSEVELIFKFSGSPSSVSQSLCKAIGLTFGTSLKREIKIFDPPEVSNNFNFTKYVYAEYEGCDFLYDASEDKEFRAIVKLAFGEEQKIVRQPSMWALSEAMIRLPGESTKIKDLETGEVFENYITRLPVKAIVLVKTIGGFVKP